MFRRTSLAGQVDQEDFRLGRRMVTASVAHPRSCRVGASEVSAVGSRDEHARRIIRTAGTGSMG